MPGSSSAERSAIAASKAARLRTPLRSSWRRVSPPREKDPKRRNRLWKWRTWSTWESKRSSRWLRESQTRYNAQCNAISMHARHLVGYPRKYRVVQLNFTPEIEVFYLLFEISLPIFSMKSLKQHMYYMHFHFRCKIQLDIPVFLLQQSCSVQWIYFQYLLFKWAPFVI